jgi:hypothetical protein
VTLVDNEDGSESPSLLDEALLSRYHATLTSYLASLRAECAHRDLNYCLLRSDDSLARIFNEDFTKAGQIGRAHV